MSHEQAKAELIETILATLSQHSPVPYEDNKQWLTKTLAAYDALLRPDIGSMKSLDDLADTTKDERDYGAKLALALAGHVHRMFASVMDIPIRYDDVEYLISVRMVNKETEN